MHTAPPTLYALSLHDALPIYMLVHFSVPHGLEQYSGAAWGTRDVCQGPVEYFAAMEKYDHIREIIKVVYSHQFEDDGNRSGEHTSELQSRGHLVCRLLLAKNN